MHLLVNYLPNHDSSLCTFMNSFQDHILSAAKSLASASTCGCKDTSAVAAALASAIASGGAKATAAAKAVSLAYITVCCSSYLHIFDQLVGYSCSLLILARKSWDFSCRYQAPSLDCGFESWLCTSMYWGCMLIPTNISPLSGGFITIGI